MTEVLKTAAIYKNINPTSPRYGERAILCPIHILGIGDCIRVLYIGLYKSYEEALRNATIELTSNFKFIVNTGNKDKVSMQTKFNEATLGGSVDTSCSSKVMELLFDTPDTSELPSNTEVDEKVIRRFDTGATRDVADDKFDYEAFIHPFVENRFAQYMHTHRIQTDGTLRDGDNWQKGIPNKQYLKSMARHYRVVHAITRGCKCVDIRTNKEVTLQEALCALKFNVDGLIYNLVKAENPTLYDGVPEKDKDRLTTKG